MYNIVTSFNQSYWLEIAKENVLLMDRFWPADNKIFLYHQLPTTEQIFSNRVHWIDLYATCPELLHFAKKWHDDPRANGAGGKKNSFRWNAIKFAHKTFAIWHAARQISNGWLIWVDCDAIILKAIDDEFINKTCPPNKCISYLGRKGKYSECGFVAYNLDKAETKQFLNDWESLYTSGKFIDLPETHDSYTFDHIRKTFCDQNLFYDLNQHSITDKNPFQNSLLGSHMAHAKGSDKVRDTQKLKRNLII